MLTIYQKNLITQDPTTTTLDFKLENTLKHHLNRVLVTCVLGSDNKLEDIQKTNGWVLTLRYRYNHIATYYKGKITQNVYTQYDPHHNVLYPTNHQWNYFLSNTEYAKAAHVILTPRAIKDPLFDKTFFLNADLRRLLNLAMLTAERRHGNCIDRSCLYAKYLWENPSGIFKIEIVRFTGFDHTLVIVNRQGDLNNSDTWSNAWVVDCWYKNGIIFKSSEYKKQIIKIKEYAKNQIEEMKKLGFTIPDIKETEEKIEVLFEIIPSKHLYPTYSSTLSSGDTIFFPVEYYYRIHNIYPRKEAENNLQLLHKDKKIHQQKFKLCLFDLKKKFKHAKNDPKIFNEKVNENNFSKKRKLNHSNEGISLRSPLVTSSLLSTAENGDLKTLKIHLLDSSQRESRTKDGSTAAHLAVKNGYLSCLEALFLADDMYCLYSNNQGYSPFLLAAKLGHENCLNFLIDKEFIIDKINLLTGYNALMEAIINNHVSCVELLLKHEAAIDIMNERGETPLSLAFENDNETIISLLKSVSLKDPHAVLWKNRKN